MVPDELDVIVIGAGMAGLAAARKCAGAGFRVRVLEASARVGGRIRSLNTEGGGVELGAEYVHGRPADLWALIDEAGLATYERKGEFLQPGPAGLEPMKQDEADAVESLTDYRGLDCSFVEYLNGLELPEQERAEEIGYVEGFNAADAREASVLALRKQQIAEDTIEGDRSWRIKDGYGELVEFSAKKLMETGGEITFGAVVTRVEWSAGLVTVTCADARVFKATKAVVTLPLGVLQAGMVRFSPNPAGILAAASRMRMGQVCRFTMVFRERMWPEEMSFLLTRETVPLVWWSARPAEEHTLTGWIGGPRAAPLIGLSETDLKAHALQAAASALGKPHEAIAAAIECFYTHNWQADPLSLGAYSWVPVGGLESSAEMSVPVDDTLYFAGEHTDTTGHWGTVHAALRSGVRAGKQVVESLMNPR